MTLGDLIARVRQACGDTVEPFFASDDAISGWLNDAEEEAAIRARLLFESDDALLTRVSVSAGQSACAIDPAMFEITGARFQTDGLSPSPLVIASIDAASKERARESGEVGAPWMCEIRESSVRLIPVPEAGGTLIVEGYRTPKAPMADPSDVPEIHPSSHRMLADWAIARFFEIPDAEFFDQQRADRADARFEAHFGPRPDADMRRATRQDTPHRVEPFLP